jgi:hypothetical protein
MAWDLLAGSMTYGDRLAIRISRFSPTLTDSYEIATTCLPFLSIAFVYLVDFTNVKMTVFLTY